MSDELIPIEKEIGGPRVRISKTGLEFDPNISFESWVEVGRRLGDTQKLLSFWIGDWISFGKNKWDHGKYLGAELAFSKKYGTLANAVYVSQRIEPSRRRENLTFAHHREVAKFDKDKQEFYLNHAEENGLSSRKLRRFIYEKEEEGADSPAREESKGEDYWKFRSFFQEPSHEDPKSCLRECIFLMGMVADRLHVIRHNVYSGEYGDIRERLKEVSYACNSQTVMGILADIKAAMDSGSENQVTKGEPGLEKVV